ncbi:MAG: hypothetical protein LBJ74_04865 [Heliobacteriaceae bacterium]|jgi:hypothetical protein|nr:hypothetical protein [Heliobacteriaceae bacterium]
MDNEQYKEKINKIKETLDETETLLKILVVAMDNEFNLPEMYDVEGVVKYIYGKIKILNLSINSKPLKVIQLIKYNEPII